MSRQFRFVVLGCGARGKLYARWLAQHPDVGVIVAAADPDENALSAFAEQNAIPPTRRFNGWNELLSQPKLGDVVINTTMDRLHCPSATKALGLGYHMLLEKPMATTLDDCIAIDQAAERSGAIVSVCHTMRYHCVYEEVKRLISDGAIGEIVSFEQLEPVEPIHQSHSFVRGNWGNEDSSTFMLLAKSCHDIDVLAWLVGKPCHRVSSFGSLSYFRRENAPVESAERCLECRIEPTCMYSAKKIYLEPDGWSVHARITGSSAERLLQLETSRYGRCVWKCDNNVVDRQVVSFEFDGGVTGTFTMTAFATGGRQLRLHGTTGWLRASIDENEIEVVRYRDRVRNVIRLNGDGSSHDGDSKLLENFVAALRANDRSIVVTSVSQSLASHRIVFAAEHARRTGTVVTVG